MYTEEHLNNLEIDELKQIATSFGIINLESLTKEQLIINILQAQIVKQSNTAYQNLYNQSNPYNPNNQYNSNNPNNQYNSNNQYNPNNPNNQYNSNNQSQNTKKKINGVGVAGGVINIVFAFFALFFLIFYLIFLTIISLFFFYWFIWLIFILLLIFEIFVIITNARFIRGKGGKVLPGVLGLFVSIIGGILVLVSASVPDQRDFGTTYKSPY